MMNNVITHVTINQAENPVTTSIYVSLQIHMIIVKHTLFLFYITNCNLKYKNKIKMYLNLKYKQILINFTYLVKLFPKDFI